MDDYPRTVGEFEARFATEEACREYLCRLRWPDGFHCRCGEANAWLTARGLWLGAGELRVRLGMADKLRRAMVRPGRDRLSGRVEVDESFVGGRGGVQGGRRRRRR